MTVVDVLMRTERFLRDRGVPSPRLEAELLLCHVLAIGRVQLYLAFDKPLTEAELEAIRPLVARRGKREPLAWVLGEKAFHALELAMVPGVLCPRPDTETLVEAALEWIGAPEEPVYVADVGCGSGAVGLAIAAACEQVRVYAVDVDKTALDLTRENVRRLGLEKRVAVLEGDLLAPIPERRPIDWVVSNPPYVPSGEIDGLEPEVSRWEPRLALDGGRDGLDVVRRLVPAAAARARKGVLLEIGIHQAAKVLELMARSGLAAGRTWNDLAGVARVVGARVSPG